jgi:hypothetical protein
METINRIIEKVEHYGKTKSYRCIDVKLGNEIIRLHNEIIPMDIKLQVSDNDLCGSCLRKALTRLVIYYDTLIQYRESKLPKVETIPAPTKKKRGRPKRKK